MPRNDKKYEMTMTSYKIHNNSIITVLMNTFGKFHNISYNYMYIYTQKYYSCPHGHLNVR